MASTIPQKPRPAVLTWAMPGLLLALFIWSYLGVGGNLSELFGPEGRAGMADYVKRLYPPNLGGEFLLEVGRAALETLSISFMGTFIAALLGGALVFFASSNLMFSGILFEREGGWGRARGFRMALFGLSRAILSILRSIPEIVLAMIFIFSVGLGPFAGVLALGLHTGGVLGKLFSEVVEDIDSRPLEALQATGASRLKILLYGVLPQVLPQFLSYVLYRWEVNIRTAAILGIVGAGGIGLKLHIAISLFLEDQLLTLIAVLFAMVTAVDYLSHAVRKRLI